LQILQDEVNPAKVRELTEYFGSVKPTLKEMDAVLLLQRAASFLTSNPLPMRVQYSVENTVFLDAMINEVARSAAQTAASTLGESPDPVILRHEILLRTLARREAVRLGFECSDNELEEATQAFAQCHGFTSMKSMRERLQDSGISDSTFAAMMQDAVLLEKLDHFYDRDLRAAAAEHIRIHTFRRMAAGSM
jgi:hypothetical protein